MDNSNFEKVINLAAKDTKKGARVVAKVFYRILRKKGFSENQVIDIATNILNCLIKSLNSNEQEIDNVKGFKKETRKVAISTEVRVARTFTKFRNRYDHYGNLHYSA